jgi:hypothetical protein
MNDLQLIHATIIDQPSDRRLMGSRGSRHNVCGAEPTAYDYEIPDFRKAAAGAFDKFLLEHNLALCIHCNEQLPLETPPRRQSKTKLAQRTDPHRKGAIVPGNYEYVLSYWTGSSQDPDGYGLDELMHLQNSGAHFFSGPESVGKCDACGARFGTGDVWHHIPTDEYIHLGHDCAAKYGLLVDRSAFELSLERHRAATAVVLQRKINDDKRKAFLEANPGLEEDLNVDHRIINDIASRFVQNCSLSPAQVALVHKIANEVRNPNPRWTEAPKAQAPTGRVSVAGKVVSTKVVETNFGTAIKMLVVIKNPDGSEWKAWGTAPDSILGGGTEAGPLKGHNVAFDAAFQPKEPGFAFFSRPTKAKRLD